MTTTPKRRGRPPKVRPTNESQSDRSTVLLDGGLTADSESQTPETPQPDGLPDARPKALAADEPGVVREGDVPADDRGPDEPAASEAEAGRDLQLADGWSDMDSAPLGGRPCILAGLVEPGIPLTTPAYLHESRRYTGSVTRWTPFKEWRVLNTPYPVPFQPLAWSRYE